MIGLALHLAARAVDAAREAVSVPRLRAALAAGPERIKGRWGVGGHPPACTDCNTTERPHHSRGRCQRCESRRRRASKC